MAAIKTLNEVFTQLQTKGVRLNNQWKMTFLNIPGGLTDILDDKTYVYAEGATVPGKTLDPIEFQYQAFPFSIPGRSTMTNEITFNFRGDRNLEYKKAFDAWMDFHANLDFNNGGAATGGGLKTFTNAAIKIELLDETLSSVVETYALVGAFPIRVGDISLSNVDSAIATYEATFRYQYWMLESSGGLDINVGISI